MYTTYIGGSRGGSGVRPTSGIAFVKTDTNGLNVERDCYSVMVWAEVGPPGEKKVGHPGEKAWNRPWRKNPGTASDVNV